jgi:hypothetical protein
MGAGGSTGAGAGAGAGGEDWYADGGAYVSIGFGGEAGRDEYVSTARG